MKVSFCIPLYNKANKIKNTVNSIVNVCKKNDISFEIKISNNGSTDITQHELEELFNGFDNIKILHLPKTISIPDNWLLAISLAEGDIVKLHLADDILIDFNIKKMLEHFEYNCDYVIGKTKAYYEDITHMNDYFEKVNYFRSKINCLLDFKNKIKLLENEAIYLGNNVFGDINSLYFKKDNLEMLSSNVKNYQPAFRSFVDFEIMLKLFIKKNGVFYNEYISEYHYNETSTSIRALKDEEFRYRVFGFMSKMFIYEFIHDDFYKQIINNFKFQTKTKIIWHIFKSNFKCIFFGDE